MRAGLSLRPFEIRDLPALQAIRAAAFAPVFASFRDIVGPPIAEVALAEAEAEQWQQLATLCGEGSGHDVLVVEADGPFGEAQDRRIVGFVAFFVDAVRRRGEIELNAVHPDYAGRGIGTWMYGEVLARMKAMGAEVVEVGTGADASHEAARRAYAKAGFACGIPSVHLYRTL